LTSSDREVVAALEHAIAQRIGEPRYELWFGNRTKMSWEEGRLVVGVATRHYQEWLQRTFTEAVRAAAHEVCGQVTEVRFHIDPELFRAARQEQSEVQAAAHPGRVHRTEEETPMMASSSTAVTVPARPRPAQKSARQTKRRWRRLGDFAVGPCNRVAHASALSIVEGPGQGPNPLVVHGPVGTGKTHLLEGIYVGLRKKYPDWHVVYLTAEDFTNRFVQAMRLGKLPGFRKQVRDCDALLVDDVHFLAKKRATQEEFLHTLDALVTEGRQLVLTCDVHPKLAEEFAPEMVDRLLGGAVWGLTTPDAVTRLDILRLKSAKAADTPIAEDVLCHLAEQLCGNVRELEGALHGLWHFARVTGRPIELDMAREALADLLRHSVRVVQLADVSRAVTRVLKLESNALQSGQRAWSVSHPRMLAMYLARKHTSAAYTEIGTHFGGRNHSTVVAAEKKMRNLVQADGDLALGERRVRLRDVVSQVERELLR
jgi:chromosomal replication initiator protein